jgi:hypothetical protein
MPSPADPDSFGAFRPVVLDAALLAGFLAAVVLVAEVLVAGVLVAEVLVAGVLVAGVFLAVLGFAALFLAVFLEEVFLEEVFLEEVFLEEVLLEGVLFLVALFFAGLALVAFLAGAVTGDFAADLAVPRLVDVVAFVDFVAFVTFFDADFDASFFAGGFWVGANPAVPSFAPLLDCRSAAAELDRLVAVVPVARAFIRMPPRCSVIGSLVPGSQTNSRASNAFLQ